MEEHSPQKAVHEGRDSVTTFNDVSKAGQKRKTAAGSLVHIPGHEHSLRMDDPGKIGIGLRRTSD